MSVRRAALAVCVLALGLVFASPAAAGPPRDRTPPTTPTNLRITASGPDSISLAWDASKDNSSNWWYIVQGCGGMIRVDPPKTTFTNRLGPGRTLSCSVYAVDAAGNRSGTSNVVTHTTPPDTTPPTAPTISSNGVWPTRVSVSWTPSTDNTSQVWYTLLVNGQPYGSDLIGFRGITVLDLAPATTHTFKVTVRDHFGNRNESNTLSVTTPAVTDTVAPSAPTNLRFTSETSPPELWIEWTQSTDDSDPQSLILYRVFVNGEPAGESTTIGYSDSIVYCRATGVNRIVVRAEDTSGNVSAPSNEISIIC